MKRLPWRSARFRSDARDVERNVASVKLGKGDELGATSVQNEYEHIILEPEDIERWRMAEDLNLIEDLTRRTDDDSWRATVTNRSRNWPSIDVDPKIIIDWSLLLAFNISGILYGGLHMLAWSAKFPTELQGGPLAISFMFRYRFRACIDLGTTTDGEAVLRRDKRKECRTEANEEISGKLFWSDVSLQGLACPFWPWLAGRFVGSGVPGGRMLHRSVLFSGRGLQPPAMVGIRASYHLKLSSNISHRLFLGQPCRFSRSPLSTLRFPFQGWGPPDTYDTTNILSGSMRLLSFVLNKPSHMG